MKLEKVLDQLNSFEKNSFLKVITDILSSSPKNQKQVDDILSDTSRNLKNIDNQNIARVFEFVEEEYIDYVTREFKMSGSQLDIALDIVIRDGNCIMKQDWFSRLYEREIQQLKKKVRHLHKDIADQKSDISPSRIRDYKTYSNCLRTAYTNDDENDSERKVTSDENSIVVTLAECLDFSQEEIKLLNYGVVPIQERHIDEVINEIKNLGIAFYSKKSNTVFIADEIVRSLRSVRGKEVADKFKKRVLKCLREPQINLICKAHNINWRESLEWKIKEIVNEGIKFRSILGSDIHREGTTLNDRKKFINELYEKKLGLGKSLKGTTLEDKIDSLVEKFNAIEREEKVGISLDGYEQLISDLDTTLTGVKKIVKEEYELQGEQELSAEYLLDFNIKPRDVLDLMTKEQIETFCKVKDINLRGDESLNILEAYKDSENLYLENYVEIGKRQYGLLRENGINIKEAEIGVRFESLTKNLFEDLGFNVDEDLRKKLNSRKDKMDILLNLGEGDLILIECKTVKESGFNKFSSVSRQLKAYRDLVDKGEYRVIKSLLVAPEFSDDFISECELEYELNLSLISAESLLRIVQGFKKTKMKQFPFKLLMRDVVIQEERILKALVK